MLRHKHVSRDQIVRLPRGQGNYNIPYLVIIIFSVQLTRSKMGNLTPLIHSLLYVMTTHTYFEHSTCKKVLVYWKWSPSHVAVAATCRQKYGVPKDTCCGSTLSKGGVQYFGEGRRDDSEQERPDRGSAADENYEPPTII